MINLTNEKLVRAADYCGVRSGRDVDKFAECHLTRETAEHVSAPMIAESPVNIECRVHEVHEYGSHHMFAADVLAVHADEQYMDENGTVRPGTGEPDYIQPRRVLFPGEEARYIRL